MYDYDYDDIVNTLKKVGLQQGDKIFNHSNLGFFGRLKDAKIEDDYCSTFLNAIFDIIGNEGTLIVPVFSYSFCWNKIFDKLNTPGICGLFSEYVRKQDIAKRSDDANFSIASIGYDSHIFTDNAPVDPFGPDSFWDHLYKLDGKICNFNFDSGSTFFHYVEKVLDVPYRTDKFFKGISIINGKETLKTFSHYVRDNDNRATYPDFETFDFLARKKNLTKFANLGRGQITSITLKDTMELILTQYKNDPNFLIKGKFQV